MRNCGGQYVEMGRVCHSVRHGLVRTLFLGARASYPQSALRAGRNQWRPDSPAGGWGWRWSDDEGRSGQRAVVTSSPIRSLTVAVLIAVSTTVGVQL